MRGSLVAATLLIACGGGEQPFEPGFEPLEDLRVEAPAADGGTLPEAFAIATGTDDAGMHWGHLRGFVHGPLVDVWAAYQQADVVVDRRRVAEWGGTAVDEPDADFAQDIDHRVEDIITIEYVVRWRHAAVGDLDAPDKVSMRWQKTEGGALIETLRGSVALLPTDDPDITEVQSIEHLKAPRTGPEEVEGLLTDVWADVVAFTHGRPLPTFD